MNSGFDTDEYDRPLRQLKVAHLVFGVFFLGIAALWALAEAGTIDWEGTSYLVPATLLGAGAIGLGASLLGSRANRRPRAPRVTTNDPSSTTETHTDLNQDEPTTTLTTEPPTDDTQELR